MGELLSQRLGQPFIIENRPGAGTNIGTEAVVRAPADGYTLLLASPPAAINATLYEKLNFSFIRDIAPIAKRNPRAIRHGDQSIGSGPRPFQSSLPTPTLVLAKSAWLLPALGPDLTWPASYSR